MQALSRKVRESKSGIDRRRIHFVLFVGLLLFGSLVRVNAQGFGSIQLVVTDRNEVPIPRANLCFVLSNQTIGGKQTDPSGRFNASLPPGAATVFVSRQGFLNNQQTFTITNGVNLFHQFRLSPGTSTPLQSACGSISGTAVPGNAGAVRITNFSVVGGTTTTNPRVTLRATFDQYPRAYRIREFNDAERYPEASFNPAGAFQRFNVPWFPMPPGHMVKQGNTLELEFNLNLDRFFGPFGTHLIYLEVAKVALYDTNGSVIPGTAGLVSDAKSVAVVLAPANLKTFTLTGPALQTFIQQARSRGIHSTVQMTS